MKGAGATFAVVAGANLLSLSALRPVSVSTNPLADYTNRNWETLYRDIYA
ncbi:MAG: hypothetical protein JRG76_20025, partial [Deltaproteobacteria bacterium]|nr:hypothetical protein [Deltaproteobacteria bacterium]